MPNPNDPAEAQCPGCLDGIRNGEYCKPGTGCAVSEFYYVTPVDVDEQVRKTLERKADRRRTRLTPAPRCDEFSTARQGVCDFPLDERGECAKAGDHR